MQELHLNELTPWNLEANTKLFISDLGVNPVTLHALTFKEIAGFHKSPTIGVSMEDIVREVKAQNKFLGISVNTVSINPLRPDISDIELALIHTSRGNIPDRVLCEMLNITVTRLRYLRRATEALYNIAETPLPSLPLITITDTSRYWSEEELMETYGISRDDIPSDYGIHYKELLRSLESRASQLDLPINFTTNSGEGSKKGVPNRTSVPSTLLKEDKEDYSGLSNTLWSYVSREGSLSSPLQISNWDSNEPLTLPIDYTSCIFSKRLGKDLVLNHQHSEGGYNSPLVLPKVILQLSLDVYNLYVSNNMIPPALERIIINLLTDPVYSSSKFGVSMPPLSSNRGHCMPISHTPRATSADTTNSRKTGGVYLRDSPPLIYPKFSSKHYGYGIICHECSTFLSENTTNVCKHLRIETFLVQETGRFAKVVYKRPHIYVYIDGLELNEAAKYSLYYYNKDIFGSISTIYTPDLLQFYTNISIPLHKLPFE